MARNPDPNLPQLFDPVRGKDLLAFLTWVKSQINLAKPALVDIKTVTAAYTLTYDDRLNKYLRCNFSTDTNITVPNSRSVKFPIGTRIDLFQVGAGQIVISPGTDVTVHTPDTYKSLEQYSTISLICVAEDEWDLSGDLEP